MSIEAADLRKLVKIVRQYEVIYGGGISTSDAAIREECEGLVGLLESELGISRRGLRRAKAADALPSLVEAKRGPKRSGFPRPASSSRNSELADLASSDKAQAPAKKPAEAAVAKPAATVTSKTSVKKGAAKSTPAAKSREPERPTKPSAAKPTAKSSQGKPKPTKSQAATKKVRAKEAKEAPPELAEPPIPIAARAPKALEDEVDIRSRHAGAAKAAVERADRIAGRAESSDEVEGKRRFAATHLFDAFRGNKLPKYGGYIVCLRFVDELGYTVIEIIGYENLQDLYPEGDTLVFKSVGCKLYAIVEPAGYLLKSVEPVNRPSEQMIPYRFNELLVQTTKQFQNVLVGRKPVFMPTSFSVFKPLGEDLAILFYDVADVYANIQDFIIMILRDRLGLPAGDSRKAGETIARGIREFKLWLDEA